MKVVAFVPVKLRNARLPGKNLMKVGGRSLVRRITETIGECVSGGSIDEAYVFCSDPSVESHIACGVRLLVRSADLDLDSTGSADIIRSFIDAVSADVYVLAHATSPFTSVRTVRRCVQEVLSGKHDSAMTVRPVRTFLWVGDSPVNYDPSNIPRTQDLPAAFLETSGVYVFTRDVFVRSGRRVGFSPYLCEVTKREAIDIDTSEDLDEANRELYDAGTATERGV